MKLGSNENRLVTDTRAGAECSDRISVPSKNCPTCARDVAEDAALLPQVEAERDVVVVVAADRQMTAGPRRERHGQHVVVVVVLRRSPGRCCRTRC